MTPPRLRVHPAAREEIRAARRYYAARRVGLGRAFLAEVDAVLAFALAHAEMYPALDADDPAVCRALLHRFPYVLVYELVGPASLVVLTCFDLRQQHGPDWERRR